MKITQDQKLFREVIEKAWEDDVFKKELVASPIAIIEKFAGRKIKIPEGKTLVVNDQTKDSEIHINIPVKPNLEDMELNEEQLEAVAGGADIYWEVYGGFAPFVWAYETGKEIGTSIVS